MKINSIFLLLSLTFLTACGTTSVLPQAVVGRTYYQLMTYTCTSSSGVASTANYKSYLKISDQSGGTINVLCNDTPTSTLASDMSLSSDYSTITLKTGVVYTYKTSAP